jgi:hypothetical protein
LLVEDVSTVNGFHFSDIPAGDASHPNGSELPGQDLAGNYTTRSNSAYAGASSQSSPEPPQTDLQGHYIGPASGVSFLLRVQKRLHQAISFSNASTIFTFGDAPINNPEFDPTFCMMLPREDAQRLVDRYFDFAMPTYRFLHRPSVQKWFEEFYDTLGVMRDPHNAPAKIALIFMVFAQARQYMPDNDRPGPEDLRWVRFCTTAGVLTNLTPPQHSVLSGGRASTDKGERLNSVDKRASTSHAVLLSPHPIAHQSLLQSVRDRIAFGTGHWTQQKPPSRTQDWPQHA